MPIINAESPLFDHLCIKVLHLKQYLYQQSPPRFQIS
jgi:hypothetical protein